ncbi:TadE/TadG family type IV pilus assembly protein [Roseomonas sp. GCM10028921]
MRQRLMGDRGIATLEFALLVPLLLLMLLGAYDVGTAFKTSINLASAARVGAQQALLTPGNPEAVRQAVIASVSETSSTDLPLLTVSCTCASVALACGSPCPSGDALYMTVTTRRRLAPLLLSFLSDRHGRAVVRVR